MAQLQQNINLDGSSGKSATLSNDITITQLELGQIPAIKKDQTITGGKTDISIKVKGAGESVSKNNGRS